MTIRNSLHFEVFNDPMFAQNGRVVYEQAGGPCWVIDPGPAPQARNMAACVRRNKLQPQAIVLTHAHADHIAGIDDLIKEIGPLPLYLAREEWIMLKDPDENLSSAIGIPVVVQAGDVRDLPDHSELVLGATCWQVFNTCGHSPGGRTFYCAEEKVAIVGDALFAQGIGRYDFHHSDGRALIANIKSRLLTLPDDTQVLSGHGPDTTIGVERRTNPYLA